jgi:hypothetical protein
MTFTDVLYRTQPNLPKQSPGSSASTVLPFVVCLPEDSLGREDHFPAIPEHPPKLLALGDRRG